MGCQDMDSSVWITRSVPKVMRINFLRSAEGPGKESGGRGRRRGNPGIQFDLPQLSLHLCSSQYISKMCSSFCVLSRTKIQRSLEQHYANKFCTKLGKSGSEMLQLFRTAYGDAVLSSAQVLRWHKAFNGRESVEDKQRAGRPSTSRIENNVARVKAILDRDQCLSVRLIAEEVGLLKTDVHRSLQKICTWEKFVRNWSRRICPINKRTNVCWFLRNSWICVTSEPDFLQQVITGDETWVFEYDPTTKRQSSEWHTSQSPQSKKAWMSKSRVKSMFIFFDSKGIVHKEFVPPGQTVNQTFYLQVLERLRNRVVCVRCEIANTWFLHHDNAPSHTSFTVREFLSQRNITMLPHPPYSPDLAPCDFFLFPKLKTQLKGHHFGTVENVQAAATRALNISGEDFLHCYEEWQQRWNHCIRSQEAYFEGDKL